MWATLLSVYGACDFQHFLLRSIFLKKMLLAYFFKITYLLYKSFHQASSETLKRQPGPRKLLQKAAYAM
jgi:hypothetical protein